MESDPDDSMDQFWHDPALVAGLTGLCIVARINRERNAKAFYEFNQLFPVDKLPSIFVFGPNSTGPTVTHSGLIPSPADFPELFYRAITASGHDDPPIADPTPLRRPEPRVSVAVQLNGQVHRHSFRPSETLSAVRRWIDEIVGEPKPEYDILMGESPLPDGDMLLRQFAPALDVAVAIKPARRETGSVTAALKWLMREISVFGSADDDPAEFWRPDGV
jgi:hypothetical protein